VDWHGCFDGDSLTDYLEEIGLDDIVLHTKANISGCKLNGHPSKNCQDWIEVLVDNVIFQVQCLFFELPEMLENEIVTLLQSVRDTECMQLFI